MPSAKAYFIPLTRREFNRFVIGKIPPRSRDEAFEWIKACEGEGRLFVSAAHAINAWVFHRMARDSTKEAPPTSP